MPTRLLIALTLLAPLTAHAQAGIELGSPVDARVAVPNGYGETVPAAPATSLVDPEILRLRGGDRPALQWQDRPEPTRRGPSFARSWGHAWAGFGMGTGAGAILGGVIVGAACDGNGSDFSICPLVALLGAGLGAAAVAPLGAALATWGFGENNGGTGNFFAALGGSYLGAALGLGVGAIMGVAGELGYGLLVGPIVGVVASTLGASAGYQLSSSGDSEPRTRASSAPLIVPTLAPTEGGASVGVAGMF